MLKSKILMLSIVIIFLCPLFYAVSIPLNTSKLFSILRFNETNGSIMDSKYYSSWATVTGGTPSVNHVITPLDYGKNQTSSVVGNGNYYNSLGDNDYRNYTATNNYTICARFYINGAPSSYNLFFSNGEDVANAGILMYLDNLLNIYVESGNTGTGNLGAPDGCPKFPMRSWQSYCISVNASGISAYQNGTFVCRDAFTTSSANHYTAYIGRQHSGTIFSPYVLYDELAFFNGALTDTEITNIENVWLSTGAIPVYSAELILYNSSFTGHQIRNPALQRPKKYEAFYVGANFSIDGVYTSSGNCSFTASNISAIFDYPTDTNITFSSSAFLNYSITEGNTSMSNDLIVYAACKAGNPGGDFNIYGNNVLISSLPNSAVGTCPAISFYSIPFSVMNGNRTVNISFGCPSCTATKTLTLIHDTPDKQLFSSFRYTRKFYTHGEILTNYTSYYAYKSYQYGYDTIGNKTILISCNNSLAVINESFIIYGYNASAVLSTINNIIFYQNMLLNASESYNFTFAAYSDYLSFMANITFNNTLMINTSSLSFSASSRQLNRSGLYNVSAIISNSVSNYTFYSAFYINDTKSPEITIISPGPLIPVDKPKNFLAYIYDANLYAVNYTVYNTSGEIISSTEIKSLTSTDYTVNFSMDSLPIGTYNFSILASDSHTDELITAMKISGRETEIIYNDKIKISAPAASLLSTAKLTDRYSLTANFPKLTPVKEFILESDCALDLIENSEYPAHFVDWCSKLWIDFAGAGVAPEIIQEADNKYRIIFKTDEDTIKFNSIGGININQKSVLFEIIKSENPYDSDVITDTKWFNTEALDSGSVSGVLLYFFLFLIFVFLVAAGFYTEIPAILILSGIYCFFYSILIFAKISAIAGGIFIFFGLILIISAVMYIKE